MSKFGSAAHIEAAAICHALKVIADLVVENDYLEVNSGIKNGVMDLSTLGYFYKFICQKV
jgi:hypothetical protein